MKYAFQGQETETAKAFGRGLSISTKTSILICKAIRGKNVERAKTILNSAISLKDPIKFTKFNDGVGHKPGIGPGRYPIKACSEILAVLKSAEANAQDKGLGSSLVVEHAAAHMATRNWKYGRQRRRKEKSTHVEIVLREVPEIKKKDEKPAEKKVEAVEKKEPEVEKAKEIKPVAEKAQAKTAEKPKETQTPKKKETKPKAEEKK